MPFQYPEFLDQLVAIRPDCLTPEIMAVEMRNQLAFLKRKAPMNEAEQRLFYDVVVVGFSFTVLRCVATAFGDYPVDKRSELVGGDSGVFRLLNAILTRVIPEITCKDKGVDIVRSFGVADFPELREDPGVGIVTLADFVNYRSYTIVANPRDSDFRKVDIERLVRASVDVYSYVVITRVTASNKKSLLDRYFRSLVGPDHGSERETFFAALRVYLAKKDKGSVAEVERSVVLGDSGGVGAPRRVWRPLSFLNSSASSSPVATPAFRRPSGGSVASSSSGAASDGGGSSSAPSSGGGGLMSWFTMRGVDPGDKGAARGGAGDSAPISDDVAL